MKFTFAPEATPLSGYTIKRAIDRGGFGEVYYALSDSGKEVALKLLQRNQQVELRGVRQCLNLKHPNLVTIFDIRTDADEDHWVVMEFVSGKSLEQVLDENPKGLPVADVDAWLAGIAAGIGFLHDRGIVHRDLKPANVFRESGIVKIGDVGLSKFITPSRRSAQTESVGTVYYMAPEVARGKYGSELDVYSLGVMLYEMLTGQVPFNGESTGEILMKHLTEPPDLSKIAPPFRPVLSRALEKDPQRRTPGAVQLAEEFRRALQGKPVAEEVPASHFVDVQRLEQQVARESRPAAATHRAWENRAAPVNGRGAGLVEQRANGNGANLPGANPTTSQLTGWPFFVHEVRGNKWLLGALIVLFLSVSPVLGHRNFARGVPFFGLMLPAAMAYVGFWFVTHYRQLSRCGGSRTARGWAGWCSSRKRGNRGQPINSPSPAVAPPPIATVAPPPAPPVVPVANTAAKPSKPKANVEVYSPNTFRDLTLRRRMTDLSSSMTLAVFWSLAATLLLGTIANSWPALGLNNANSLTEPAHAMLFGVTTILGSWGILLPARLWEGDGPETSSRRFVMTAIGGAIGASAWWLGQVLFVELPFICPFPGLFDHVFQFPLLTATRAPTLAGYVTFFATLFGLRRWCWQADGFRHNRLRLRSWIWSGAVAFFVPALFTFPEAWGVCWALAISAVVQLSSPWVPPKERPGLVRKIP
jgi:eukaryotic-like serine/threonine-protein kinase